MIRKPTLDIRWTYTGRTRPDFAEVPEAHQESVWDYPRPPALVRDHRCVVVGRQGVEIARSTRCYRVLETASPPAFYLPPEDVRTDWLLPAPGASHCEWKGRAIYWRLRAPQGLGDVAVGWSYPQPNKDFSQIAGWLSFYPGRMECWVDGERVRPQAGGFYGGWITNDVVGPFKGSPGTGGW